MNGKAKICPLLDRECLKDGCMLYIKVNTDPQIKIKDCAINSIPQQILNFNFVLSHANKKNQKS